MDPLAVHLHRDVVSLHRNNKKKSWYISRCALCTKTDQYTLSCLGPIATKSSKNAPIRLNLPVWEIFIKLYIGGFTAIYWRAVNAQSCERTREIHCDDAITQPDTCQTTRPHKYLGPRQLLPFAKNKGQMSRCGGRAVALFWHRIMSLYAGICLTRKHLWKRWDSYRFRNCVYACHGPPTPHKVSLL